MPEFSHPFAGNNLDRTLSHGEILRAVRFSIAAEFEAIQLYMQIAESTDNELVKKVMIDVANEEREHAGEFLKVLIEIEPDEMKYYKEGVEEVKEMMEELEKGK